MNDNNVKIDTLLMTLSGVYSITNIEHILGIVLMVIDIIWILFKAILKIYSVIKKRSVNIDHNIIDVMENLLEGIENDDDYKQR